MSLNPIVETSSGRVRGATNHGVVVFRGLPFAAPPTGSRRFQPPQPVQPWAGIREAIEFAPAAAQGPDPLPLASESDSTGCSEDCLTLNLWTPGTDNAHRPVLVWIHGGSFLRGSASMRALNGSRLARCGDVVVVSIQYRLGALGFLYLNDLCGDATSFPANLGLRDQMAALQWVRQEIAAFGGNPRNVTVFGQSAGAISASVLLGVPTARGLFDRAILQSGPPMVTEPAKVQPVAEALLKTLGIGVRDIARLRDVPVDKLLACDNACAAAPGARPLGLAYLPVVDGDLLPAPPLETIRAGASRDVDVLIGTNVDEMTPFLFADPSIAAMDDAALLERCARIMPGEWAPRAVSVYREARSRQTERTDAPALWLAMKGDFYVRHPSMRVAELQHAHSGTSYAYLFTWQSPYMGGMLGACHGLELPFVFGTYDVPVLNELTGGGPEVASLSDRMQAAWLAFARDGSPARDGLGDWLPYDATRRATMILGRESGRVDAPMEAERSFWDEIYR